MIIFYYFSEKLKNMTTVEYNKCVNKVEGKLFGFILKKTKDSELTKDIIQESFTRLWINKDKVELLKASSWLFTTAYNYMLTTIKRQKFFISGDVNEKGEEDVDNDIGRDKIIISELKKLKQRDRRLIILRDVHGFSYKEIGTKMGLNETQVKVYLFRVRKILKERFKHLNR